MSYSFFIAAPKRPDLKLLLGALDVPDVRVVEGEAKAGGEWPTEIVHLYCPGTSLRVVELAWSDATIKLRILSLSGVQDYELGLKLAVVGARMTGSPITCEDRRESLTPEALMEHHNPAWIENQMNFGADVVGSIMRDKGETVTVSAVTRAVYFGPRVLRRVGSLKGEGLRRELQQIIKEVEWGYPDHFAASVMEVAKLGGSDRVTCAAWSFSVYYLFPKVQYLIIQPKEGYLFVPIERAAEAAGEHFRWLDDGNSVMGAIPEAEREAVMGRAAKFAMDTMAIKQVGGTGAKVVPPAGRRGWVDRLLRGKWRK